MKQIMQRLNRDLSQFHEEIGLGAQSHEKAICRHIASCFFARGTPAFACTAYPASSRGGDRIRRDECDLVIRTSARDWLWIEAKQIWKPGAAHWLWVDAVNDVKKLASLRAPEAAYVGILLVGVDTTKRERHYLSGDIDRFVRRAGLGLWTTSCSEFDSPIGMRISAWAWWRPVTRTS
jgi:hypothetical protein